MNNKKKILGVSNRSLLTERDWNPNYPKVRDGEFVIVDVSFICRD